MENLRAKPDYFRELYEQNLPLSKTYKEAYEKAEKKHEELTGQRMYADHASFRVVYTRQVKKKKK
jgi:hypothetical protein